MLVIWLCFMYYTHKIMSNLHKMDAQNSKILAININFIANVICCYGGKIEILHNHAKLIMEFYHLIKK